MLEPGIHYAVPYAEYAAWKALSRTNLVDLARSPAYFCWRRANEVEPTAPMDLGVAIHTAVLEPERFDQEYAILAEEVDRRTKDGRATWEAFERANRGRKLLRSRDGLACVSIATALRGGSAAATLIQAGRHEVSLLWRDEGTGLLCKARADVLGEGRHGPLIIDLKSTQNAQPHAFSRSISRDGLYMQAAHYLAGLDALGHPGGQFLFVAYETSPPFWSSVHRLSTRFIDLARQERETLLQAYRFCEENGAWPDHGHVVHTVEPPAWHHPMSHETELLLAALK